MVLSTALVGSDRAAMSEMEAPIGSPGIFDTMLSGID